MSRHLRANATVTWTGKSHKRITMEDGRCCGSGVNGREECSTSGSAVKCGGTKDVLHARPGKRRLRGG